MNRRLLFILVGGLLLVLVLGFGAVAGGALVYFALQAQPVEALAAPAAIQEQDTGLLIGRVHPDSPAEKAGLVRGDILYDINGKPINNLFELSTVLEELQVGDAVELRVLHGDEQRNLTATLGERNSRTYLGVEPCGCLREDVRFFAPLLGRGTLITEVKEGSPAAQAGLQPGDRITAVDGQEIGPDSGLKELLEPRSPGEEITLEIERPSEEEARQVNVTLGEDPDNPDQPYLGIRYLPARHFPGLEGDGMPFGEIPAPFRDLPFERGAPFLFNELPEGIHQAALIMEIAPDSPAEKAGLQRGDLVLAVNDQPIETPQALSEAVRSRQPGDALSLTIFRPGEEENRMVEVTLGEKPDQAGEAYLGVTISGFIRTETSNEGLTPGEIPLPGFFPFDRSPQETMPEGDA